jgi:hypothetical protein
MTRSSHNGRFVASASAGKQSLLFAVLIAVLGACGNKSDPAAAPAAYTADIEKLCDVVQRSGAEKHEANDRIYLIATWLGSNLSTPEARKFLADIQPLKGDAKANALDAEAKRVGLPSCALSAEWRK